MASISGERNLKVLKALIVDDEPLARERIRDLLQKDKTIQIIGEYASGKEASRAIVSETPDIVFLDIQIPDLDGFQVLDQIRPHCTPFVIFITAYKRYIEQKLHDPSCAYLLKPFDNQRFDVVLTRAKEKIFQNI